MSGLADAECFVGWEELVPPGLDVAELATADVVDSLHVDHRTRTSCARKDTNSTHLLRKAEERYREVGGHPERRPRAVTVRRRTRGQCKQNSKSGVSRRGHRLRRRGTPSSSRNSRVAAPVVPYAAVRCRARGV